MKKQIERIQKEFENFTEEFELKENVIKQDFCTFSSYRIGTLVYEINNALVVDNTGLWRDMDELGQHIKCPGATKVILTAPGKGTVKNIVYGEEMEDLDSVAARLSLTWNLNETTTFDLILDASTESSNGQSRHGDRQHRACGRGRESASWSEQCARCLRHGLFSP